MSAFVADPVKFSSHLVWSPHAKFGLVCMVELFQCSTARRIVPEAVQCYLDDSYKAGGNETQGGHIRVDHLKHCHYQAVWNSETKKNAEQFILTSCFHVLQHSHGISNLTTKFTNFQAPTNTKSMKTISVYLSHIKMHMLTLYLMLTTSI